MIRTLLVDDSMSFRAALGVLLHEDPEFEIVGSAASGDEGVRLARQLSPDLVLMDLVMPGMDGLQATAALMQERPCPVVIMSSLLDTQAQQVVFEALRAGAVEVLAKPRDLALPQVRRELLATLRAMAAVEVSLKPRPSLIPRSELTSTPEGLVLIGASTGGPPALAQLLGALPADFPFPVVAAQHLASGFSAGLCQWLQSCTPLALERPQGGTRLRAGHVYLAPDSHHLEISWPFLRAVPVRDEGVSPSVDRLFASALGLPSLIAVLLTGMGEDGAHGLKKLRDGGARTLVQDETSSLVYGMPKVAMELGAAEEQLSISEIGPRLLALARGGLGG